MDHLKHAGKSFAEQSVILETIVRNDSMLMSALDGLVELNFPDWLLVSGAIYNTVWNVLTGTEPLTGIKDVDVFYFDDSDLSYEAEDAYIQRANAKLGALAVPVEVRNQARVHLWYPQKFNQPFEPLSNSIEMLNLFASETHAIGIHLNADGKMSIHAPFGLEHMFAFKIVPNHALQNQSAHEAKGARAKLNWPQITVEPW